MECVLFWVPHYLEVCLLHSQENVKHLHTGLLLVTMNEMPREAPGSGKVHSLCWCLSLTFVCVVTLVFLAPIPLNMKPRCFGVEDV